MNKENAAIITSLNNFGRVPQLHELLDMIDDYKSRVEKAVEYIKEAHEQDFMWLPIFEKELLNILNGKGSDE